MLRSLIENIYTMNDDSIFLLYLAYYIHVLNYCHILIQFTMILIYDTYLVIHLINALEVLRCALNCSELIHTRFNVRY
jgi:hypothetical protein